jgi:CHAD domain
MTTAERTSIGRRLAVRRAPYRPPIRLRKRSHDSIVAPLARTLAAAVAIGVGAVLGRGEVDRRVARVRRVRDRHFGLLPREHLDAGLQRIALGQLEIAIEQLEAAGGQITPAVAVHETRKALKRLRALIVLVRDEIGREAYERERVLLRDAGRRLAGARDAEVRLATLDALIAGHAGKLAHRSGVAHLRAQLAAERDEAAGAALSAQTRTQLLLALRQMHARVGAWQLARGGGISAVEPALRRIYRRGRRRLPSSAGGGRKRTAALHEWRKRVKDLRYAAEILDRSRAPSEPGAIPRPARKDRARKRPSDSALYMRGLARRADALGELLGEEHDLALFTELVHERPTGRRTRKVLLKLIAERRKELRREALRAGRRLYARPPARFLARARRCYERGLTRR